MNARGLLDFMKEISKEKDLSIQIVKNAIEEALVAASKKNLSAFDETRCNLDIATGELKVYVMKNVVDFMGNPRTEVGLKDAKKIKPDAVIGDLVEVEIDPAIFGRIAAQSVRQFVVQKLKDAERDKVFHEYTNRVGEVVSGTVLRFNKRDAVLQVGKSEAVLPRNEMPATSRYRINDRIKCVIESIDPEARGPIIQLSRTSTVLVEKLFEQEVPEIADGTVKIVKVVRDPGSWAKIAVESKNRDVDPIGACVGVKGARVQMIVRELENEKIDIIQFDPNIKQFIANSLVRAQIQKIDIDEDTKTAMVLVQGGNMSLAIGKRGQNAKLAAKLTGYRLDISSEDDLVASGDGDSALQRQYLLDFLMQVDALDEPLRDNIINSGLVSVKRLSEASVEEVTSLVDDNAELAAEIVAGAGEYMESLREMTRQEYGVEGATTGHAAFDSGVIEAVPDAEAEVADAEAADADAESVADGAELSEGGASVNDEITEVPEDEDDGAEVAAAGDDAPAEESTDASEGDDEVEAEDDDAKA